MSQTSSLRGPRPSKGSGSGRPLTLASDLDGVGYQFHEGFARWLVEHRGWDPARLVEPHTYSLEACWGMPQDEVVAEQIAAVKAGELFHTGYLYEDCLEPLREVAERGHRIIIVTARDLPGVEALCRAATEAWAAEVGFPYEELHVTSRKHEVDFDLLVDDAPSNVRSVRAHGKNAVLLDRPFNRDVADLEGVKWSEVPDLLEELAERPAA